MRACLTAVMLLVLPIYAADRYPHNWAWTDSEQRQIQALAQKIRKASTHQGGWRYQPSSRDSDISCTGWSLMSLRSARNNGARIPVGAIEQGVKFIMSCRSPRGDGGFCYQPGSGPGLAPPQL